MVLINYIVFLERRSNIYCGSTGPKWVELVGFSVWMLVFAFLCLWLILLIPTCGSETSIVHIVCVPKYTIYIVHIHYLTVKEKDTRVS